MLVMLKKMFSRIWLGTMQKGVLSVLQFPATWTGDGYGQCLPQMRASGYYQSLVMCDLNRFRTCGLMSTLHICAA